MVKTLKAAVFIDNYVSGVLPSAITK